MEPYLETALACDRVAVVSDACSDMLRREIPELSDRLVTIHNILDVAAMQQRTEPDPYPDKSVKHIVSVGRLVPEKHFENAVYTAKTLNDRRIRFCWHLVGDGPLRGELEALVKERDVSDYFSFEGNQPNPYPWFRHADRFVHPSHVESFGIVVAEALSLGTPCVVTKSIGVMDFLQNGENALLTEQSSESLTEAVLEILSNDTLLNRITGNTRCPEQFLADTVKKKIHNLLEGNYE